MSRQFWIAIALICAAFATYETVINALLRGVNDKAIAACVKPAKYSISYEYYFPNDPDRPKTL